MDQKARRIFIATALGTMAGLFTSIYFFPYFVWWLGALVGGFFAGFIYSLPEIIRYSPNAFMTATRELKVTGEIFLITPIEVYKFIHRMTVVGKLTAVFCAVAVVMNFIWAFFFAQLTGDSQGLIFGLGMSYAMYSVCIFSWTTPPYYPKITKEKKIKRLKRAIFLITPLGVSYILFFATIKFGPKAISWIFTVLAEFVRFFLTFAKTLFLFVHSRELVLCAIDAGLAVLISYPLLTTSANFQAGPSILLAGLLGGLLGILHYKIVSVRLLHLIR